MYNDEHVVGETNVMCVCLCHRGWVYDDEYVVGETNVMCVCLCHRGWVYDDKLKVAGRLSERLTSCVCVYVTEAGCMTMS